MPPVVYRIDAADRIVAVNAAWEAFACANDAPELTANCVLQQPLWEFVRERSLTLLYQQALAGVRTSGQPLYFPYRCDSPTLKRYMRMTLLPQAGQAVEFHNELLYSEPLVVPLIVRAAFGGRYTLPCCSLCRSLYIDGIWTDVATALTQGRVLVQDKPLLVVYRVCEACRQQISCRRAVS